MSSGFAFGANKPAETPAFGQTPVFGSQQPGNLTFGVAGAQPSNAAALPQFASAFGSAQSTAGYQFSSPATTTSAPTFLAPTFNFNTSAAQPGMKPTGVNFGVPASNSIANTGPTFGTALTSQSHNLFATPTPSVPNTGLTFGTPKPTIQGIGLPFSTQASTAPAIMPTFSAPGSTAPAASIASMFGTLGSAPPNTGFGYAIPSTKQGPTFGSSVATTGLGFAPSVPSSVPSTGLTLATSTVPSGLPTFGAPTLLPTTGTALNFTTPASSAPASSAPSTGLSFNSFSKPTTSGLTFGTPAGLTFGVSSAATNAQTFSTPAASGPALSFATSLPPTTATVLNFATTTTTRTTTPAATIATSAAVTTTASTSIGFGRDLGSSTTTTSSGLPLDLGGSSLPKLPVTTTSASFNLLPQLLTTTTTSTPPRSSVGLGGISATPPKQVSSSTSTEQVETAPKDQVLPNELLQTVENFKKFIQEQKSFSSEISRFSVKELKRVEGDIIEVNNCISEMESDLQKDKAVAEKLKYDTATGLQHIEMAQRTFDTPSGLQYDNTAPLSYFIELCDSFEKDMYTLKVHIENIDKCVRNTGPPTALTSQDLALGMRRLHETFVALAGRLQSVHNQVEFQKEQYLNLRKQVLNDYSNIFESRSKELEALEIALDSIPYQPPTVFTGPTPFSSLGNSQAQALAQNPPPAYPGTTPLGVPASGFSTAGPTPGSFFGSNIGGTSSMFNTSSAFQLQKPPVGNKRGKP